MQASDPKIQALVHCPPRRTPQRPGLDLKHPYTKTRGKNKPGLSNEYSIKVSKNRGCGE